MASSVPAPSPVEMQDPKQVADMVERLNSHAKRDPSAAFSCKKATYSVDGSNISVHSWKMTDQEYKKPTLPTYARGLFTCQNSRGDHEIAIRGYDKFFNYDETPQTQWRNIETNTKGPYHLSVKENGCIIFMSGLEDATLLVCSKHSTGEIAGGGPSHSLVGKEWVGRHLASVNKTPHDLARKLREMNATAVAELCDDAFEEHVLAYTPEHAGLYLHGIVLNLPRFVTYPPHLVDAFAAEWGFKQVMHLEKPDITTVKSFCEHVAETGSYDGRDTEGFVIRCKARLPQSNSWEDWFFKYKFEEPYLMYRQWRECTRAIIEGKEPKYKKHREITAQYLDYARRRLHADPALGRAFNQNHGIIKLRDDFLANRGITGAEAVRAQTSSQDSLTQNVVLVPVATIGCGKTTVALAMVQLLGWGHIQNDNIEGKQRPQRFAHAVCNLLAQYPVVIADRNNHQRRERKQLIQDVQKVVPEVCFVALHYVHEDLDSIRAQTRKRVLARGDNHQTIQAVSKGSSEIISIMEGFMHRFEPLNVSQEPDTDFDKIIDLDPTASSRENLEIVLNKLRETYPSLIRSFPSRADMDEAIQKALTDYTPTMKHDIGSSKARVPAYGQNWDNKNAKANGKPPKQPKAPRTDYFSLGLPAERVAAIVESVFRDQPLEIVQMYQSLKQNGRVQTAFHVTLIHRSVSTAHQAYWDALSSLHYKVSGKVGTNGDNRSTQPEGSPELGICKVLLERIVWDERVMCIVVRLNPAENSEIAWRSVNEVAHVTIGTASPDIKPKESNDLLRAWIGGDNSRGFIRDVLVRGHVELMASVRAVAQRF